MDSNALPPPTADCYLPTLLHFASAYGLRELTSKLLHCPLAYKACHTRNKDNLTPAQLAHHLNHSDIGALLQDFQRLCESDKLNIERNCRQICDTELTDQQKANHRPNVTSEPKLSSAHHHLYGLSLCSDILSVKNIDHLSDRKENNLKSKDSVKCDEYEYVRQELSNESHSKDVTSLRSIADSDSALDVPIVSEDESSESDQVLDDEHPESRLSALSGSPDNDLTDVHNQLIGIIEQFKKGMSFGQLETIFENWQKKYCNGLEGSVSKELKESLTQIKNLCEIGRKHKELENNKYSLNFNDLRCYLTSKLNNKFNDNNLKVIVMNSALT